jgi:regulator of sirC expression with transglutaminase-like and TPR domain
MPPTDPSEPERFLKRIGETGEAGFDLAEAGLALASLSRPGLALAPYRQHLAELASAVNRRAGSSRPTPPERLDALVGGLARDHGYRGDRETYDDLANADLTRVIERRRGIPVSLGILYIATARAQGWRMSGVNTPGHFLVRLEDERADLILDPFSGRAVEPGDPGTLPIAEDRAILLRLQNNIKSRLLGHERYEEASRVIERMLWIAPKAAELWWESALVDAELGRIAGAISRLDRCLALDAGGRGRAQAEALRRALRAKLN